MTDVETLEADLETPPRVFLVEDHDGVREDLRALLETFGMVVIGEAVDGVEGVEHGCSSSPDVILMDLRMPRMDGIEATRRIKKIAPHVQVLILTAYDESTLDEEARDAGAYAFLVKGCSAQLIRDIITFATRHARCLRARHA